MKIVSREVLLKEYQENERFIEYRSSFSSTFRVGMIVRVSYGNLGVGPTHALFLKKKKAALRFSPTYYNRLVGIVVKKGPNSIKIASHFRGYSFYKSFVKDSPNLISVRIKVKGYFKAKGSNITKLVKPGTFFNQKLLKLTQT